MTYNAEARKTVRARQKTDKELFLEQIEQVPNVQAACHRVGIPRSTVYRWMQEDDKFEAAVRSAKEQGRDVVNDAAEGVIISAIKREDMAAAKYWLGHNNLRYSETGKERLLQERREHTRMLDEVAKWLRKLAGDTKRKLTGRGRE